jgi:hypothetical protein
MIGRNAQRYSGSAVCRKNVTVASSGGPNQVVKNVRKSCEA